MSVYKLVLILIILREPLRSPGAHKIHFHRFMGDTDLVERMLEHFPNLYIGFTGNMPLDTQSHFLLFCDRSHSKYACHQTIHR